MKKIKVVTVTAMVTALLLNACVTVDSIYGQEDEQLSPLELQSIQTREFDATQEEGLKAVVAVFQDLGFNITESDRDIGLITGVTTTDAEINNFWGYARSENSRAIATVTQASQNHIRIRISIVKSVSASGSFGMSGTKESTRTDPSLYQEMFSRIQQNIFLQQNL